MFTILLKTPHGWTTDLGPGENSWATEASAEEAWDELRQLDESWSGAEIKVVPAESLGNYDLVA